ncbi:hypothetical protein Poly24_26660 [Rosistilla carotiformis]|uniref:PEP-CTERM protein-sorting domain-containing protein n=1 Tax=Rosistilla carotiformis TaxID=2528017 RepID=A0A518JTT4_9BACT|nr:PEP-CTERM sorting domain-containing protein [Rosistilla carotiformis]QDV68953.1 hypothetical protein Poly24_26660 [Rosistilla carotiformis]
MTTIFRIRTMAVLASLGLMVTANADIITFSPVLDMTSTANTSSPMTPYVANNMVQAQGPTGIPDNVSPTYSDTYFFRDAGTGIEFSIDMTWNAAMGLNLNTGGSALGLGSNSVIGSGELVTIGLSGLSVDLTNYIDGSFNMISNPTLGATSLAFRQIDFNDFGDTTIVNITNGIDTVSFSEAAPVSGNFDLPADGLTDREPALTFSLNNMSFDTDFNISAVQLAITADLQATAGVPEPTSMLLTLVGGGATLGIARRKSKRSRGNTQTAAALPNQ